METIRRYWKFYAENENGDCHYLNEDFVGTDREAEVEAERLTDEWESKTGGLVISLTMESHGKVG